MNKKEIVQKTKEYIKNKLEGESSGHDWFHIYRVWQMSIRLAKKEKGDLFVVELAALLHDIADWKFTGGDEDVGPREARKWLDSLNVNNEVTDHVCYIIKELSFKGAKVKSKINTIEGKVVQDADKLDAIGAIGIGRTFAYGGHKGRSMYNPVLKPKMHKSFDEYKKSESPTINHFYEKLLLLKDLMNTKTAKKIALKRHNFMKNFLDQFLKEWEGKDK